MVTEGWSSWEDWPDWPDNLSRVEVEYEDGTRAKGVLTAKDDDHGDPLWVLVAGEVEHSFADCERWRFLP